MVETEIVAEWNRANVKVEIWENEIWMYIDGYKYHVWWDGRMHFTPSGKVKKE